MPVRTFLSRETSWLLFQELLEGSDTVRFHCSDARDCLRVPKQLSGRHFQPIQTILNQIKQIRPGCWLKFQTLERSSSEMKHRIKNRWKPDSKDILKLRLKNRDKNWNSSGVDFQTSRKDIPIKNLNQQPCFAEIHPRKTSESLFDFLAATSTREGPRRLGPN